MKNTPEQLLLDILSLKNFKSLIIALVQFLPSKRKIKFSQNLITGSGKFTLKLSVNCAIWNSRFECFKNFKESSTGDSEFKLQGKEFAKLRAFRAYMPKCLRALRAYAPYVPTCLRASNCYVPTCLRALYYYVPTCLRTLNYCVPTCLRALRAYVSTCLKLLRAYVPAYPHFSRVYYVLTCVYIFFMPTCLCASNYFVPTCAYFSSAYLPRTTHEIYWGSFLYLVLLFFS